MNTQEKKIGLSVCIIAKNEEKMLPGCLESVKGCADEIILADTGSTDRTKEIAAGYGCRIIDYKWRDDFAHARNTALNEARYPYILSIDADERLRNPDELQKVLNNAGQNTGGWLINVRSEAQSLKGGTEVFVSSLLRLFINHPDVRFYGVIHEQIVKPILKLGYKIQNTNIKIAHIGYGISKEDMQKKHLRNLNLLNKAVKSEPQSGYYLNQRAQTQLALGNPGDAEKDIAEAIRLAAPKGLERPQMLNFGSVIAMENNDLPTAKARALESLGLLPDQAFANFILAEVYYKEKNFAFAFDSYKKIGSAIEKADTNAFLSGDYYLPQSLISFKMGKCLVGLNLLDEAYREFEDGLKINPEDVSCMIGIANVLYKKKNYLESMAMLNKAAELSPDDGDIKNFISVVNKAAGLNDAQAQTEYRQSPASDANREEKPLISLSMIVKNEEADLPGCLKSARGIADEIIIVDTGSVDRTKEIARSFGAKVYDFEWVDDFAAARNEALRRCTGKWVLYLDADERLNPENSGNIRPLLENTPDNIGAYIVTLESDHRQMDGGTELHRGGYPRIFRNLGYPDIKFTGRVHEQITPSIFALGKNIDFSDITITHLGYNQPREVMEQKIKRNYRMLIQHVREEPLNGYAWYQLGQTLSQMQLRKEAENAIRFALETGSLSDSVYSSAAATLSQLVGNKKQFEESLYWAEKSLDKAPEQVYALNLKAYSQLYLEKFDEAEKNFLEVLKRIRNKKGVPRSGFDIDIPENVVLKGLNAARKKTKDL